MTTATDAAETCSCHAAAAGSCGRRAQQVDRALQLEYLTVGWNIAEGVLAVAFAVLAGSVAILGFGIDSFVECASGSIMIARLRAERSARLPPHRLEQIERRAQRGVAASLFLLAAYVGGEAIGTLRGAERPEFSLPGVLLLCVSIAVMLWLAAAKRRAARDLGSEALAADAFQTTACWWLSVAALAGVSLNGWLGWWWADPVAALVIAALIAREGREAWRGRACC